MKQRIKLAWAVLTGQEKKYAHHFLGKVYIDNTGKNIADALFLINDEVLERGGKTLSKAMQEKTTGLQISHIMDSEMAPNEKVSVLIGLGAILHRRQEEQFRKEIISHLFK